MVETARKSRLRRTLAFVADVSSRLWPIVALAIALALAFDFIRIRYGTLFAVQLVAAFVLVWGAWAVLFRIIHYRLLQALRKVDEMRIRDLVSRARLDEPNIPKVDLHSRRVSPQAGFHRTIVHDALGGMTAVLAQFVKEPSTSIESLQFPFPKGERDVREVLIAAITCSTGLARNDAESLLLEFARSIEHELRSAKEGDVRTLEVFPIGLYQHLDSEYPVFAPQHVLLAKVYPGLAERLAAIYPRSERVRA